MTGCLSVLAFLCQGVCEVFYAKKKQIVIALSSILVLQWVISTLDRDSFPLNFRDENVKLIFQIVCDSQAKAA